MIILKFAIAKGVWGPIKLGNTRLDYSRGIQGSRLYLGVHQLEGDAGSDGWRCIHGISFHGLSIVNEHQYMLQLHALFYCSLSYCVLFNIFGSMSLRGTSGLPRDLPVTKIRQSFGNVVWLFSVLRLALSTRF